MKQKTVEGKNDFEITTDLEGNNNSLDLSELIDSLKSIADDLGQMCEMLQEEKILVEQFFKSLFEIMQPLTHSMKVSPAAIPVEYGKISQSFIDPTGHLALVKEDDSFELKNLADEHNRDLMISVIRDILPKFKFLTSEKRLKIENRI